jgi:hypothetical protein
LVNLLYCPEGNTQVLAAAKTITAIIRVVAVGRANFLAIKSLA